jgi:hypothetical protein
MKMMLICKGATKIFWKSLSKTWRLEKEVWNSLNNLESTWTAKASQQVLFWNSRNSWEILIIKTQQYHSRFSIKYQGTHQNHRFKYKIQYKQMNKS